MKVDLPAPLAPTIKTNSPFSISTSNAARAKVWAQMFADVMNTPVQTLEANETGALGCAIAVAAATGAYKSLNEAIEKRTVFSEVLKPDPEAAKVYEKKYQLYKKALASLDGLWDDMQALVENA